MKLGSLFDGSGTCPLAASSVGITPAWASEIEPFPRAVTASHFPSMLHVGDITKLRGDEVEPVDVISFGSPCQNLSIAGNRKGLEGAESSLFLEAVRVIREMRQATNGRYPQIAIWENVTGAFSSNKGNDFKRVLEELCQICDPDADVPRPPNGRWGKAGLYLGDHFSLAWRQLDAQYWGVPQRRKRIYAVLDLGGQCAGRICFEREGLSRNFKEVRRKGQAASRFIGSSPLEHDMVSAVKGGVTKVIESHPQDSRVTLPDGDTVQTLASRMGTGGNNVPMVAMPVSAGLMRNPSGRANGIGYEEEKSPTLLADRSPAVMTPVLCMATAQANAEVTEDIAPTITAAAGMSGNNQPMITVPVCLATGSAKAEITDGSISPTLLARAGTGGGNVPMIAYPLQLTSITEQSREERL